MHNSGGDSQMKNRLLSKVIRVSGHLHHGDFDETAVALDTRYLIVARVSKFNWYRFT